MKNNFYEKQIEYLNDILADILKSFWDERGRGARYRTTLAGVDRFSGLNYTEQLPKDVSGVVQLVKSYLEDQGIVTNILIAQSEDFTQVLEVEVYGCLHSGMENKLQDKGLEPLACPCANLIIFSIEKSLGLTTELAEVKLGSDYCKLCIVFFRAKD